MSTRKTLAIAIAAFALLGAGVPSDASAQARAGRGPANVGLTVDDLIKAGWDCTKLSDGYYCTKDGETPRACTLDGKTCARQARVLVSPFVKGEKLKTVR